MIEQVPESSIGKFNRYAESGSFVMAGIWMQEFGRLMRVHNHEQFGYALQLLGQMAVSYPVVKYLILEPINDAYTKLL